MFSIAIVSYLLMSELGYYFNIENVHKMTVDGTRGRQMTINFDIDFPRMPCCLISIELEDMAQNVQHHLESRIKKVRLNLNGEPISDAEEHAIGGALKNETHLEAIPKGNPNCGSCYGAGEKENECCNTCDDVRAAYSKKRWTLPRCIRLNSVHARISKTWSMEK